MKTSDHNESYLYAFFCKLQSNGFGLGIEEYKLLLQALREGGEVRNKKDLKSLCKLLWLKSEMDEPIFNNQFKLSFAALPFELTPKTIKKETGDDPDAKISADESEPLNPELERKSQRKPSEQKVKNQSDKPTSSEELQTNSPASAVRMELDNFAERAQDYEEEGLKFFMLEKNMLPLAPQNLHAAWRRFNVGYGSALTKQIDIPLTIRNIGRRGFFMQAEYRRKKNRNQLLALIDRDGSMIAFHEFAETLLESARSVLSRNRVERYYFRNAPSGRFVFKDIFQLKTYPVDQMLAHNTGTDTVLLIISDGGAARGRFDTSRIEQTTAFLKKARQGISRMVWVNPMPRKRWRRTSAGVIARYIDMYEASEEEFGLAIRQLKR